MNLEEYKIFHALIEEFKKAHKDGYLIQLLIDQRDLNIYGDSQNYEWTLTVKKKLKKSKN